MLNLLFSGDTLFTCGCGRLFEGTAEELYKSLQKLITLPEQTLIYPGHEYTVDNIKFALTVDPDNQALHDRLHVAQKLRSEQKATVPASLATEAATNPFLRTMHKPIRKAVNCTTEAYIEQVFAKLRKLKDKF